MKQKSWHLDRRELLKGGGIALALPFLNSMSRAMGVSGAVALIPSDTSHPARARPAAVAAAWAKAAGSPMW